MKNLYYRIAPFVWFSLNIWLVYLITQLNHKSLDFVFGLFILIFSSLFSLLFLMYSLKPYELILSFNLWRRTKTVVAKIEKYKLKHPNEGRDNIMMYLKRDNKALKDSKQYVRDLAAKFYKTAKSALPFKPNQGWIDYQRLYASRILEGSLIITPKELIVNNWVVVMSNSVPYKGKQYAEYGCYGNGYEDSVGGDIGKILFVTDDTISKDAGSVWSDTDYYGCEFNPAQLRFATEEEIALMVEKQFVLGEN